MIACLTRKSGTSSFGIFRGLYTKTRNSPWKVQVFDQDQAVLFAQDSPVLLSVWLDPSAQEDQRYATDWGWRPEVRHAVVYFSHKAPLVQIADPAIGMESWGADSVRVLWHGVGLELVKRR
jgi:hypothetical protein